MVVALLREPEVPVGAGDDKGRQPSARDGEGGHRIWRSRGYSLHCLGIFLCHPDVPIGPGGDPSRGYEHVRQDRQHTLGGDEGNLPTIWISEPDVALWSDGARVRS